MPAGGRTPHPPLRASLSDFYEFRIGFAVCFATCPLFSPDRRHQEWSSTQKGEVKARRLRSADLLCIFDMCMRVWVLNVCAARHVVLLLVRWCFMGLDVNYWLQVCFFLFVGWFLFGATYVILLDAFKSFVGKFWF